MLWSSTFEQRLIMAFLSPQEDDFCKWLAAFRMASRGKSAGSTGHSEEVRACKMFLDMQRPSKMSQQVSTVQEYISGEGRTPRPWIGYVSHRV